MADNKKVAASPNSSSNSWFRDNSKLSESDKKALEMSKYLQSIKPKGSGPMANTTKKLEKFLADVDDMDLPTRFKNEVGRVARKDGIKAAGNLIAESLNITKGVDDIPIPKEKPKKPKKPMNKGGIIKDYTKVGGSNITKVGGIPVIKITEGQRGDNIKIGAPIKSTLLK